MRVRACVCVDSKLDFLPRVSCHTARRQLPTKLTSPNPKTPQKNTGGILEVMMGKVCGYGLQGTFTLHVPTPAQASGRHAAKR